MSLIDLAIKTARELSAAPNLRDAALEVIAAAERVRVRPVRAALRRDLEYAFDEQRRIFLREFYKYRDYFCAAVNPHGHVPPYEPELEAATAATLRLTHKALAGARAAGPQVVGLEEIQETMRGAIRNTIATAIQEGWDYCRATREIRERFDDATNREFLIIEAAKKKKKVPAASPDTETEAIKKARKKIEEAAADALEKAAQQASDAAEGFVSPDAAYDAAKLDDVFEALAKPTADALAAVVKEQATAAIRSLNVDQAGLFNLVNKDALEYAKTRGAEMVGKKWVDGELVDNPNPKWAITETTREGLRDLVARSYEDGWTPAELKQAILEDYNFSPARAKMIARTETAKASVYGTKAGWIRSGVVEGKSSLLSNDHDDDDICDEAAEQGIIPLDEDFANGFDGPPYHPNCNCVLVAEVIEPDEEEEPEGGEEEEPGSVAASDRFSWDSYEQIAEGSDAAKKAWLSRPHGADRWDLTPAKDPKELPTPEDWEKPAHWKSQAYGGVIVNESGQFLLREPKGHYDGYVWTWPKGKMDGPKEHPVDTALREVEEETGHTGEIVAALPGTYKTEWSQSNFFIMRSAGASGKLDNETKRVRWVDYDQARKLINKTYNDDGRHRDKAILERAVKYLDEHHAAAKESALQEDAAAAEKAWQSRQRKEPAPTDVLDSESKFDDDHEETNAAHEIGLALNGKWEPKGKYLDDNSTGEVKYINQYRGAEYENINGGLRSGYPDPDFIEAINAIDAALERASTTDSVAVYRGFGSKSDMLRNLKVGDSFIDQGFVSTSLSPRTAADFSIPRFDDEGRAIGADVARIVLPKGSPAAYISTVQIGGKEANKWENEVLLPRQTRFILEGRSDAKIDGRDYTVHTFRVGWGAPEPVKLHEAAKRKAAGSDRFGWSDADIEIVSGDDMQESSDAAKKAWLTRQLKKAAQEKEQPVAAPKTVKMQLVGSANHMGGAHDKYLLKDQDGQQWLFKPATTLSGASMPLMGHADEAISKIAALVRPDAFVEAKATSVEIPNQGKVFGSVQKIQSDIATPKDFRGRQVASLQPWEVKGLQEEQVLDWLTSNHDSHGGQFLRTTDNRVIGIDKTQAFRYFGQDHLSTSYQPNTEGYGEAPPIYNTMWKAAAAGKLDVDPKDSLAAIARAQAIPDATYRAILKPYAEARYSDPSAATKFLDKAVERKHNLKNDFKTFFAHLGKPLTESEVSAPSEHLHLLSAADGITQEGLEFQIQLDEDSAAAHAAWQSRPHAQEKPPDWHTWGPGKKAAWTKAQNQKLGVVQKAAAPKPVHGFEKPEDWHTWGPGKKAAWTKKANEAAKGSAEEFTFVKPAAPPAPKAPALPKPPDGMAQWYQKAMPDGSTKTLTWDGNTSTYKSTTGSVWQPNQVAGFKSYKPLAVEPAGAVKIAPAPKIAPPPPPTVPVPKASGGYKDVGFHNDANIESNLATPIGNGLNPGWAASLAHDSKSAIDSYKGSGYHAINEAQESLRFGKPDNEYIGADYVKQQIAAMDKAFKTAKTSENVVTYRGFGYSSKVDFIKDLQPGQQFIDKGFMSTSLTPHTSLTGFGGKGMLAQIEIPKGSHAAYISHWEQEVLIARGSKFTVISREYITPPSYVSNAGAKILKIRMRLEAQP